MGKPLGNQGSPCAWCGEVRSRQAMLAGHPQTVKCQAEGYRLRAEARGLVRVGPLVGDDAYRVERWLPVLVRGRAPFFVLPTGAVVRRRGRFLQKQLWLPKWMNLLLATQPRHEDPFAGTILKDTGPLVALLRWAGRDPAAAKALDVVHETRSYNPLSTVDLSTKRVALFELFLAANPHQKLWEDRKALR